MNFRADIQALRALAVLLVLAYHLWPARVPGGYVGVDVFFVISGYLITGLLMREAEATGRIALGRFYLRRAARLLPAALLVLAVVLLATAVLRDPLFWPDVARQVAAAALYIENWYLHFQSLDYLAGETAASPVEHYWSLGVEEQFYLIWPLALLAGVWLAARVRAATPRGGMRLVLGLLVVASLAYALWSASFGSAGPQYFSTLVRVWQLGIGGLLAAWGARMGARWAWPLGLLGVLVSAWWLDSGSVYPGYLALLPTLSAALMIAAGERWNEAPLRRWLGGRPVQYLGNISYSLYLWHWPLIAFAALLWPGPRGGLLGGALLLLSVALAAASKHWVEDRFRLGHGRTMPRRRLLFGLLAASAVVLLAAARLSLVSGPARKAGTVPVAAFPGAAAVDGAPWSPTDTRFIPSLAQARQDLAQAYASKCLQNAHDPEVQTCVYGPDNATLRIALVGDSHAAEWYPAFRRLSENYDVQFVGIGKNACAFSFVMTWAPLRKHDNRSCLEWSHRVVRKAADMDLDVILVTQYTGYTAGHDVKLTEGSTQAQVALGMIQAWRALEQATGEKIMLLYPTPYQPTHVAECAASHDWPFTECTRTLDGTFDNVPFLLAARRMPRPMLDFTNYLCIDGRCPAVIGGVFVYRDDHHITATYMRTLAPILARKLHRHGVKLEPRTPTGKASLL